jgi:hypothetical protein
LIDFLTIVKKDMTDMNMMSFIEHNGLQCNSMAGKDYYDNQKTKNLSQQNGLLIRIGTNQKLTIEGSLQKYYNEISGYGRHNYNLFPMSKAKEAITCLLTDKEITDVGGLKIRNYEIGLTINVLKDCRSYLDRMTTIGVGRDKKDIMINPRYGDKREKVTEFPDRTRKFFKAYDKGFESREKKRKLIPAGNLLRIETVNRRLDNCLLTDFFAPDNLMKMVETFFRDWRTVQFIQDIITPKGTGRARQRLCMDIMNNGPKAVLKQSKEQHANGSLSDWEYRNIREFITHEWDTMKSSISFIQSEEEKELRQLLNDYYTILRHDDFIK